MLEWFVEVEEKTRVIWSEWSDYYEIDGATREQLELEMIGDIKRFIDVALTCEARLVQKQLSSFNLELKVGQVWRVAGLDWMTAGVQDEGGRGSS